MHIVEIVELTFKDALKLIYLIMNNCLETVTVTVIEQTLGDGSSLVSPAHYWRIR